MILKLHFFQFCTYFLCDINDVNSHIRILAIKINVFANVTC